MASGVVEGGGVSSSAPLNGGENTVWGSGTERSSPASALVSVPAQGVAPAGALGVLDAPGPLGAPDAPAPAPESPAPVPEPAAGHPAPLPDGASADAAAGADGTPACVSGNPPPAPDPTPDPATDPAPPVPPPSRPS
ncbi:hypothetical protein NI25_23215 [Streptomyces sp. CCM_MD2014]|nr:hypothetical protein NI25_23215 [Streptomyces sp. CCM_MD2014]